MYVYLLMFRWIGIGCGPTWLACESSSHRLGRQLQKIHCLIWLYLWQRVSKTSHLNFGSQSKSNFKGLSVTRKNSTEKPEQGWLFWKAKTGLQPVFAGVVEAIPGCAFSCNATSTLTVCKSLRPKPVSHQILSPYWKMKKWSYLMLP